MDNFVMWKKRKYSLGIVEIKVENEADGSKTRVWSKEKLNYFILFYFSKPVTQFLKIWGSTRGLKTREGFFPLENHSGSRLSMWLFLPQKFFGPGDHGNNF